ncbi:ankyrin repeat family protein [Wolffia australiana]
MDEAAKYAHSPVHLAVLRRDHAALRRLVAALPRLPKAGEVATEEESMAAEKTADAVSAAIDRRDVPNRETPLHLAVRLRDLSSAEILMAAGADWSLQNEQGWSALQEAVCTREDAIAMVIARHYQPLAWAKWCRRLPRIVSSIARIRDFYMEISFHFESSVIPFIGRIAPSDTYRIWKRGPNLRADMTLAGFDGLRIQRSAQTFLFLGHGGSGGGGNCPSLPPGSLLALSHKDKEVANALEGAGAPPTEAEVAREVAMMAQTNMYRPGIDVTQAELVPHLNWRRQERVEAVGQWKTKVYDMHHVVVSLKSRHVPGAMTDEELFAADAADERAAADGFDDVLTPEEKLQLDSALSLENSDDEPEKRQAWFGWSGRKNSKAKGEEVEKTKKTKNGVAKNGATGEGGKHGSEYKKGLRPVLWLTPDFPLQTQELLPLLDVLANKVKAVRRLRELLTTKLPPGTFPVKMAIPVVPTIRVMVTFSKFEELQGESEFATPPSSPSGLSTCNGKVEVESNSSWYSWVKGGVRGGAAAVDGKDQGCGDGDDPFLIPPGYTWVDSNEKKQRMKEKKGKTRRAGRKHHSKDSDSPQTLDGFE